MRFTIWQQFSSNHSSSIVLVGKFASAEQAEEAANLLRYQQAYAAAAQIIAAANEMFDTLLNAVRR